MNIAFRVVREFESALCYYTGARYAVTTNSCTNALLLCVALMTRRIYDETVYIPKRTYVGVPQSIRNAGASVGFDDREWRGSYSLNPYPIRDSARRFTSDMYRGGFECVSFHVSKILGIDRGGAILLNDGAAYNMLRRMRYDGRAEGVDPKDDRFVRGWQCYMSPGTAAEGLRRLSYLPKHNDDLPNSDYPDLSLTDWNNL